MDDFDPTSTSPITEALGATNVLAGTWGFLSIRFMRVRCRDTAGNIMHLEEYSCEERMVKLSSGIQDACPSQ